MGMQPGAVSCPTYFNIEAYEGLPTEYRKLLDEAEATGYAALKAAYTAADDKNIPMFADMGLERGVYTPEIRAEIEEKAPNPVWETRVPYMTPKNLPSQAVLDPPIPQSKTPRV